MTVLHSAQSGNKSFSGKVDELETKQLVQVLFCIKKCSQIRCADVLNKNNFSVWWFQHPTYMILSTILKEYLGNKFCFSIISWLHGLSLYDLELHPAFDVDLERSYACFPDLRHTCNSKDYFSFHNVHNNFVTLTRVEVSFKHADISQNHKIILIIIILTL